MKNEEGGMKTLCLHVHNCLIVGKGYIDGPQVPPGDWGMNIRLPKGVIHKLINAAIFGEF